jgi:hypothetical protein
VLSAADLARTWAAAREPGVRVVATPLPGKLSAAFRGGGVLPGPRSARGRLTYAEHLRG